MFCFRQLIDFYFFGRHRLDTMKLLPLGSSLADAVKLYGTPLEEESLEEASEIIQYTFSLGLYHEAVVLEWKQKIQSITYWSVKSDPARDLRYMLEQYQCGSRWCVMEEGYWYHREDDKVRLWCSAVPAIGVGYIDFLDAKAEYETAHRLTQLSELSDITWIPNDAVFELQRQFVEDQKTGLTELTNRSDKITASPDGRHVFIVRNHETYEVEGGFRELNAPPDSENGLSTEVINCFTWSEDVSVWGKIVLPRDANVDFIRFDESQCHLQISRVGVNLVLTIRGPAESILRLEAIDITADALDDNELWKGLGKMAELID